MLKDIPGYRYKQLAEALASFGFTMDDKDYILREYVIVSSDKFFYFFTNDATPNNVLVLLIEDYISDLDYVKDCFTKELNARLVKLHTVVNPKINSKFEERLPAKTADYYQLQDDWSGLAKYAVDFQPFYFGFLATIIPKNTKTFWTELHDELEVF